MKNLKIAKLEIKNGEKYFQTLEGHTRDALKILKAYYQRNRNVIAQFCKRWSLNEEKFLKNLFLIVYFHDVGKLTKEFQRNIRENKSSNKYPHALYGFFLLHKFFTDPILEIPIELAPILGHHTQLYNQIYYDHNLYERPTFLLDEIKEFASNVINAYKKLRFEEFFNLHNINVNKLAIEIERPTFKSMITTRGNFVSKISSFLKERKNWERVKSIYSFLLALLQTCDDYSSVNFSEFVKKYEGEKRIFDSVMEEPEQFIPILNINAPEKLIFGEKKPYEYQKALSEAPKFVTLFAPCGRGKTEAALLWAVNALAKYDRNKIIFAMPTQTTSNAMYDRLKKIFGKENVGLYHGRCFVKLKEEMQEKAQIDEEEKDVEEIRSEVFKGNIFFKPITITTIDHLIYSCVKGFSQADFAFGNLQNAVVIFDEVHYYEKLTLEHLLTLFEEFKKLDIPHLLMSGTFPEFMLERLGKDYTHISDEEGLKYEPFKLELCSKRISDEETVGEIIENYKRGLTQFVIVNTVERAKLLYLKLKEKLSREDFNDLNLMLYHSQFTYKDRIKKEAEIYERIKNKPFILVSTQVIEISLDISSDVMFSELAPPDALGQRAGRLNRKGKNWKGITEHKLKLYLPEKDLPYDKDLLQKTLSTVEEYLRPLNYGEIKELCDKVYFDYKLMIPSNLLTFLRDCAVFGYNWKDITFDGEEGRIFKVREEKFQYIDVIPAFIYEQEGDEALRVENMAKVPLCYLLKDRREGGGKFFPVTKEKGGRQYWICSYPYDYEIGFKYDEEMENLLIW